MKKAISFKLLIVIAVMMLFATACGSKQGSTAVGDNGKKKATKDIKVVFIPKMTGNAFFESGNDGAQAMGKRIGFTVKYDGAPEGTVANQVQIINSAINSGADAIAISSVTSDGLNQVLKKALDAGIKVVTWDSDVNPKYRSVYVDQGTPEILGKMLVDMAAGQMKNPNDAKKIAWFYSSPTVPDQNSWVKYANQYIKEKYPKWQVVTTQFGDANEQKSLQVGQSILDSYPGIDAIICPDSTALPAMAQAAENKGLKAKDVIITGFASPNSMRQFIENGTINNHGLWDVKDQGALAVYVAYWLASGHELKVGDSLDVPGIGKVKLQPNTIQGYTYKADNSGIIVLPKRIVFTKDNTNNYNF
jgi:AI-2 transport system substrate-binding protein